MCIRDRLNIANISSAVNKSLACVNDISRVLLSNREMAQSLRRLSLCYFCVPCESGLERWPKFSPRNHRTQRDPTEYYPSLRRFTRGVCSRDFIWARVSPQTYSCRQNQNL